MKKLPLFIFLIAAAPLAAQQPAPDRAPKSHSIGDEAQEDVGDMRPVDQVPLSSFFHGSAQIQGQYTSNAKLMGNEGSGDFLWIPGFQGGMTLPLSRKFTLDTTARLESVLYSRFQDTGFYGVSGDVTLDYLHSQSLPHLYIGVQPYYYLGFNNGDTVGEAVAFSAGLTQARFLFRGKTMAFYGYNYSNYIASPSLDNRDSHRLLAGFTQQLNPATYVQLFYAYQFTTFSGQDRDDSRHVVGLNMVYQFTQRLFGTVSGSFINNHSTNSLATYQSIVMGTGLTFQF